MAHPLTAQEIAEHEERQKKRRQELIDTYGVLGKYYYEYSAASAKEEKRARESFVSALDSALHSNSPARRKPALRLLLHLIEKSAVHTTSIFDQII